MEEDGPKNICQLIPMGTRDTPKPPISFGKVERFKNRKTSVKLFQFLDMTLWESLRKDKTFANPCHLSLHKEVHMRQQCELKYLNIHCNHIRVM